MHIRPNVLLQRRAVAILTLLAMLVAPLCASICGSRVCAGLASTPSDDCHNSWAASDSVPRTGVAAIRVCGLQEFPTAALNEPTTSADPIRKDFVVDASSNFVLVQSVQLAVSDACYSRTHNESCLANTSVQPTVLRI